MWRKAVFSAFKIRYAEKVFLRDKRTVFRIQVPWLAKTTKLKDVAFND
ncbi:hypothetical protein [Olleya sp. ITB9]|nr:hypothetical protein [Olleya sp. ITB9]